MQRVDFFSSQYVREGPRTDERFGIIDVAKDDPNKGMACTMVDNPDLWDAIVSNPHRLELTFQPVDKNIVLHPSPGTTLKMCDGMLYNSEGIIVFVELKNRNKNWIHENVEQLKSTVNLFCNNHDYRDYRVREAYAANKKHLHFHFTQRELTQTFRNETHFRLKIQNNIEIK